MEPTKPRILLAEDDDENREALSLMLKLSGYVCLTALDGRAAVDTALAEQPALVLMDLSLPELDGLAAVRELRAQAFTQPIIIVSAYDDLPTRERAAAAGANDYATKPIEFSQLLAVIKSHLPTA